MTNRRFCSLVFLVAFLSAAAGDSDECVYTLYIKTGSIFKAGTDSNISITLGDSAGRSVWIPNVQTWGMMGSRHDYFETGNLDIFSGRGPCIGAPLCRLQVVSDGTGSHHGWYCSSVEVTSSGPDKGCSQTLFYVNQWLATDAAPYSLKAVVDGCLNGEATPAKRDEETGRLVVGFNHQGSASQ